MSLRTVILRGLLAVPLLVSLAPLEAQKKEKRDVQGLIYDLKHPEVKRRTTAANALGDHRVRRAVPALIELTKDPDDMARYEATRALVRINDTRALPAYVRLTHDEKRVVQKKAIEGIIAIYVVEEGGLVEGIKSLADFVNPLSDDYNPLMVEPYVPVSQKAIDALSDLLTFSDSGTRKDAATVLGILRAHSALPAIQETLEQETDDGVKVELVRAIYKIGDPEAGSALIRLIRDPDKKVHDEAIFTLGRLRVAQAVPQLKELYSFGVEERRKIFGVVPVSKSDHLQKKVLEALAYIGDSGCRDIFLGALEDQREAFRRYGAEGLGRMADSSVTMDVAKKYLREDSGSVRLAMGFALFRMGREEHLVELIDRVGDDQAYFYLLELEPAEVAKLYPYLSSKKSSVQTRLLDVIGMRGDMSALSIVQPMVESKDENVVSAANLAIRRLRGRHQG